jgi:hypothetical protein
MELGEFDLKRDKLFLVDLPLQLFVIGIAAAGQRAFVDGLGQFGVIEIEGRTAAGFRGGIRLGLFGFGREGTLPVAPIGPGSIRQTLRKIRRPEAAPVLPVSSPRCLIAETLCDEALLMQHALGAGCFLGSDDRHDGRIDVIAIAAARLRRLEGAPGVEFAVRQACDLLLPAKMELGLLRVADRPAAVALQERLDALALGEGDDKFFDRRHIRLGVGLI